MPQPSARVETARGVEQLIGEFQLTHLKAARRFGRPRDAITHLVGIPKLEPRSWPRLRMAGSASDTAKLLAGLPQVLQLGLSQTTVRKGLSVRALERRIRHLNNNLERSAETHAGRDADIVRLEQQVGEIVGTETRINYAAGWGRISFTFRYLEALEGILERLGWSG